MIVSSLLIVLGFKLLLINEFNSITPYWDQWDAEGGGLYAPIIAGHFNPYVFISAWNEHRILFTRIISLAVFYGVGLWYPALEMVVNSFIHCAAVFAVVYLLTRSINVYVRGVAILVSTLIYIIPFDWENTLAGFQSEYYLLVLFSVLSVHMMSGAEAFSRIWLIGLALSVASYFNLASGALTAAASGAIMALQLVVGSRQRTTREYAAVIICIAVSVIAVMGTPYSGEVTQYKVSSLYVFAMAVIDQASYPFMAPYGLLQYIPSLILVARVLTKKPRKSAYEWSALAIIVWLGSQIVAISYGRGNQLGAITSPRFTDVLLLGLSANLGVAFYLLQGFWSKYFRTRLGIAALFWRWLLVFCLVVGAFSAWAVPFGRTQFAAATAKGEQLTRETANASAFLHTGNMAVLQGKPLLDLPLPTPQQLAAVLSNPTIRSILHPALTGGPLRQDLLLPMWLSKLIRDMLLLLMRSGQVFIGIGLGMWLAIPAFFLWNHDAQQDRVGFVINRY